MGTLHICCARCHPAHAAQVFSARAARQRNPQFAQAQFRCRFGRRERGRVRLPDSALVVHHVGNTVHTRQTTQRQCGRFGQPRVETARYAPSRDYCDQRRVSSSRHSAQLVWRGGQHCEVDIVMGSAKCRQISLRGKEGKWRSDCASVSTITPSCNRALQTPLNSSTSNRGSADPSCDSERFMALGLAL
jgi:hypothetical protein